MSNKTPLHKDTAWKRVASAVLAGLLAFGLAGGAAVATAGPAAAADAAYVKSSTKSQTSMTVYFTSSGARTFYPGYAAWWNPWRGYPTKVCLRSGTHAIVSGAKKSGGRCHELGRSSATEWNVRWGY